MVNEAVFVPKDHKAVTIIAVSVREVHPDSSLGKPIWGESDLTGWEEEHVVANDCITTVKIGDNMLDLYKEFRDWLSYNYPGVKPEPLQEDLMKIALRSWDAKVTKTASKTIIKELAKLITIS